MNTLSLSELQLYGCTEIETIVNSNGDILDGPYERDVAFFTCYIQVASKDEPPSVSNIAGHVLNSRGQRKMFQFLSQLTVRPLFAVEIEELVKSPSVQNCLGILS